MGVILLSIEQQEVDAHLAPTLHIHLLGEFRMLYGKAPVPGVDTPRLQSLLAYLVMHRDVPQSRFHLAFTLMSSLLGPTEMQDLPRFLPGVLH